MQPKFGSTCRFGRMVTIKICIPLVIQWECKSSIFCNDILVADCYGFKPKSSDQTIKNNVRSATRETKSRAPLTSSVMFEFNTVCCFTKTNHQSLRHWFYFDIYWSFVWKTLLDARPKAGVHADYGQIGIMCRLWW